MKCRVELSKCLNNVIDHRGLTPKKLGGSWADTGYRAISAKNIKDGKLVQQDSIRFVCESMYRKWMPEEVSKGDIILTSEAPFGEAIYWNSAEKIVLSQRVFGLKVNPEVCESRYLYYWIKSPEFQGELRSRATGTTVVGLRQPELLKCHVNLPSLERQRQISEVLAAIDEFIQINNQINDYLATLVDLEFSKRFSSSVSTTSLKNVLEISTKSLKPQQHVGETWEHYSIPAFDEMHWPIFELADGIKSNKYIVDSSSILISKLNPSIKRMWIPVCLTDKAVCSTEFIVYKPLEPRHKSFYCAAINANNFTAFLLEHVTGSTGSRQRVQPKATLDYPIPTSGLAP